MVMGSVRLININKYLTTPYNLIPFIAGGHYQPPLPINNPFVWHYHLHWIIIMILLFGEDSNSVPLIDSFGW